jgi:hypothetical protein
LAVGTALLVAVPAVMSAGAQNAKDTADNA